jgi:ABC-2 type transport system permease protein
MAVPAAGSTAFIPSARHSRLWRELNSIIAITARDIILTFKQPFSLVTSVVMTVVMMGMIGGGLMQNMAGGLGFDYGEYLMVGMVVNMLFMNTAMGMTSLIEEHFTDFTQEMLIAPVSRYAIVLGKILGSSFTALVAIIPVFIMGGAMGVHLGVGATLGLLALSPLMCLAGGAFAMIFIGGIRNTKTANIAVTMISMAQMFLAGVIIPITQSTGVLFALSRIMPMTYCADLARAVAYAGTSGYSQMVLFNPAVCLAAIAALTVLCLLVGTWLFARSNKSK